MWSCLHLQSHPVPTVSPSLWCSYTSRLLIHLVAKLTLSLTLLPSSSLCLYCPSLESQLRGLEHSSPQDFLWLSSLNLPLCHVPLFLSFFLFGHHQRASQVALVVKNPPANSGATEKKCKKAKWLYEEALQIAVKRREVKSKKQRRKGKIHPFECSFKE